MNITISGASGFGLVNKYKQSNNSVNASLNSSINNSINNSLSSSRNEIDLNQINVDTNAVQRKKAKSHIGRSITGIFKNILK